MPPGLRLLRPRPGRGHVLPSGPRITNPPACLFCSFHLAKPRLASPTYCRQIPLRRAYATAAATATATPTTIDEPAIAKPISPKQAREQLETALKALQDHPFVPVNLSRVQLAIRGLQQPAGHESIRVAVLGLKHNEGNGGQSAKELLRLLLADPLKSQQAWETQLSGHNVEQPLIVRIRSDAGSAGVAQHRLAKEGDVHELEVSCATLNGSNVEFLLMESSLAVPTAAAGFEGESDNFEETALVPTVEVPVSQDGRFTPVTAPVHQALIVTDGLLGAATVSAIPQLETNKDEIMAAVNLKTVHPDDIAGCPFAPFDAVSSSKAITLFRESVTNAKAYEDLWLHGGVSPVINWVKAGAATRTDGTTKPPVRALIASILKNALANIEATMAKQISEQAAATLAAAKPRDARVAEAVKTFQALNTGLSDWAEKAHAELREQLDLAFSGHRWRKLGWWKLFWRADDVTMISSSLLAQRFLPKSEQEVVYLAGRIDEAARVSGHGDRQVSLYDAPAVSGAAKQEQPADVADAETTALVVSATPATKWPTHISFTRSYLLNETVPALQALAEKLVLQTVGTTGLTTALAVLTYLSSMGVSEAGAVGALGLVWSLGRMQKQWETARQFWEGEVREEGRKAVRAVEKSMAATLDRTRDVATGVEDRGVILHDLEEAKELVNKAQEALTRLK